MAKILPNEFKNTVRLALAASEYYDAYKAEDFEKIFTGGAAEAPDINIFADQTWSSASQRLLAIIGLTAKSDAGEAARLTVIAARYAATYGRQKAGWVSGEHLQRKETIKSSLYALAANKGRKIGDDMGRTSRGSQSDWEKTFAAVLYYARRGRTGRNFDFLGAVWEDMIKRAPSGIAAKAIENARELTDRTPTRINYLNKVVARQFKKLCESRIY